MIGRRGVSAAVLALAALALALPETASAVRLHRIASFAELTHVAAPPNGDRRGVLYMVERRGRIVRYAGGNRREFLDIRGAVSCCVGERGLLSVAFDPAYRTNRFFYVFHTGSSGDLRVSRFRANTRSTRVVPGTRRNLLRVRHRAASNHNGGQLAFGPGGRLFASTGDGGGGCDPNGNAQRLRSRLGKLLSLNPRRLGAGWRIEGYGLRNPWRFSFDRATGRLYLADVGQNAWEEVSTLRASRLGGTLENYGWDVREGRRASGCQNNGLNRRGTRVRPVATYGHAAGRCSITGGFAYRGRRLPSSLRGWYFFADYCSGEIWRLRVSSRGRLVRSRRVVRDTSLNITSFGQGGRGELHVATQGGTVYRLAPS